MSGGLDGPGPNERPQPAGRRNVQGIRIDPDVAADPPVKRAVLSAVVEHEPGVLSKVSGLFARRQFNIESLAVGPSVEEGIARLSLVIEEPAPGVEQAKKQLAKLTPVRAVDELEPDALRRELALIKVDGGDPAAVRAVAEMYDGKTVDTGGGAITVEVTGSRQKIEAAIDSFREFGIREIARTGSVALERGPEETA